MARKRSIPRIEEKLEVGKRTVDTGRVRVRKTLGKRKASIDLSLRREEAVVRRVPINRIVHGPVPIRREGDVTIIPVLEEVPVVTKQLMLKEELHVRVHTTQARAPQTVELQSEEIEIIRDSERE